jgi:hypothetical protein
MTIQHQDYHETFNAGKKVQWSGRKSRRAGSKVSREQRFLIRKVHNPEANSPAVGLASDLHAAPAPRGLS